MQQGRNRPNKDGNVPLHLLYSCDLIFSCLPNFRFERWGSDHGKAATAVFRETFFCLVLVEISFSIAAHVIDLII